jgi:thioredoxin:protein disulfide reductase
MSMLAKSLALLLTLAIGLATWALPSPAWSKDQFLPPEQAYRYTTRVEGDRLLVTWQIEPGYYLYKKKLGIALTKTGTQPASDAVQLGEPAWPQGESHTDEFFGTQEVYRGKVEIPVPIHIRGPRPTKLALDLKLQGCADAGLCYPPLIWKSEVALPAASASTGMREGGLRSLLKRSTNDDFLPPDEAFRFGAGMLRPDAASLTWVIADGYYLYKHRIEVKSDTPNVQIGSLQLPEAQPKHDESFGNTEVYYEILEATLPVARPADASGTLNLEVTYQGCAEGGLCYNPITKTVALELPPANTASSLPATALPAATASAGAAKVSEQDSLAAIVRDGNVAALLVTFFLGGLVLSLTPCVLPMIPILSGIIVGQGTRLTPVRGFSLAFTYVQGMALTYAAAGALFAALFKTAPQATFQQPWILISFAVLFVALALAMFGAYTLQLPNALQTRLTNVSNEQKAGTYAGTFIMGALSALIVTACVAPAIVAALSVIAQAGSVARGAGALYATGIGMGVPLLIVGASAGSLLPKVGPWMDTMKSLFGVMFLGVAIYVLKPLLPSAVSLFLWSVLAIIAGFWIFSLRRHDGSPAPSPVRGAGLLVLIYGILLLLGAASGGHDPLKPLAGARTVSATVSSGSGTLQAHVLPFQRIKSVADLDRAIAAARAAGKPVMLDFYADWCASCIEMEKYTFTDPGVQAALADAVLLQADVTANDAEDKALLARFEIYGPPTLAFFGTDGVERKNFRLVGFTSAERFRDHVRAAFSS